MSQGQPDRSSLPPSLHAHIYTGPQHPQGLSPTGSNSAQEETELRASPFEPSRQPPPILPPTLPPLRPIAPSTLPASFPDPRRQYPPYESVPLETLSLHSSTVLPSERLGGSSSIPHGSRYRSPVVSDPVYPPSGRPQGPQYTGSHSLPPVLPPISGPGHWREGEAGPSSLAHSYGGIGRRISPTHAPPQQIYRRATEPGGYPTDQSSLHGGYERLRPQEEHFRQEERYRPRDPPGYPPRATTEIPYAESSQSSRSLPPLYTREWPQYGPSGSARYGEQEDPLPHYSAIQSQSSASSDYTRIDDGDYWNNARGVRRRADSDFEKNPRRTNVPKKITVACDFCRHRKLKCDGHKPICGNCSARDRDCRFEEHPKRRGPGKAAKGSRSKKRVSSKGERRSVSSSSQAAPGSADDFDAQTLVDPQLRSHASFESDMHLHLSQSSGGRYALRQPSPERTPQQQRRPPRSRNSGASPEYYSPPSDHDLKR
ncbi:hypothetical protein DFH07DRAFT_815243 [Mycena maculata]|uniref:Zn(2)-C6 fungal-type domain-containing protein n=1 Tax=Mycena maculata TaxID=230809 RepID=A0AAD7JE76_9AGAR|nr:hypothetical protein DFH07DRAFT_815243 [Mycena maculata]